MMTIGCERTDLQKSISNNNGLITPREIAECDECPNDDDCCCAIELMNTSNMIPIRLCGTSDGTISTCSIPTPPSPCSAISAGGQFKILDSTDPKLLFCMVKGNSLSISNSSGSIPAIIRLTCQHDILNPQTVLDTIPAGGVHSYLINNSCETDECEP